MNSSLNMSYRVSDVNAVGQIDGQEVTAATVHVPKPQPRPIRRSPPPPRRPPPSGRWRPSPPRPRRRWSCALWHLSVVFFKFYAVFF